MILYTNLPENNKFTTSKIHQILPETEKYMKHTESSFEKALKEKFAHPSIGTRTDVRWWMASGMHTNETILEEINAMHTAGFGGVELCQLADRNVDEKLYGYGSKQWENDVKLILNTALDLGMSVSLTSGAGWSTSNVPGLDPDSQKANQCIVLITEDLKAGQKRTGSVPKNEHLREKAVFVGAVAMKKCGENIYDGKKYEVLTELVNNGTLDWTAPRDGDITVMYYYMQGTAQAASPAVEKSYAINYFDKRGIEALKEYLENNVLNDEKLNEKIRLGDVQLFMDSLEYSHGAGITNWTENFEKDFYAIKGYSILPYMFLAAGAPRVSIWNWDDNSDLQGMYCLTDTEMNKRILDDIFEVQTKLYMNEFLAPFREWLNSHGITLRVQISYGKNLEISEPIAVVDRPEAENRNQRNQVDMYRLWSGGAHIMNKDLSAETGGLDNSNYSYTFQRHLQEAYALYASGYSRIIWHIWASKFGPLPVWPGYEGGDYKDIYYKFGTREPSYPDYTLFNDHLGRIQSFLREGKAGVDIGMIYVKYGQHMVIGNKMDWMHTHKTMFFPSTVLQDNGYTYDYFSPSFLDCAVFDKGSKTIENAGYKALVLWHKDLSLSGAKRIYALAKEGLPVVIVEGAAETSPYYGDSENELRDTLSMLKTLENVISVPDADSVINALRELGITPYIAFSSPNRQLLTQTRRVDNGLYVFAYNYCDGSLHDDETDDHGNTVTAELSANGTYIPYEIDPWTGKTMIKNYRFENGKTYFSSTLQYGDVALYALESCNECADFETEKIYEPSVKYYSPREITGWDLTVESWSPSKETETRTEFLFGLQTNEYAVKTDKRKIHVKLNSITTWDNIDEIGRNVSGTGNYKSSFFWNGKTENGEAANGAIIDFGSITQSIRVFINGVETEPVNMNVPKTDISGYLRNGENSIEVKYCSNLNNIQMFRGKVKENILVTNYLGYLTKYESYGLKQAVLIPYAKSENS